MHTESTALACSGQTHGERVTRADPGLPGRGHGGPSGGQRKPARRHGKRSAALRIVPGHRHSPGQNLAHSVTCERHGLLCTSHGLSPFLQEFHVSVSHHYRFRYGGPWPAKTVTSVG